MSRPLGAAKVPVPVRYLHNISKPETSSTTRSTWYDEGDKNDNQSSSSSTTSSVANPRQPGKEMIAFNMCWGGWFLKLTTQRKQQSSVTFTTIRKPSLNIVTPSSSTSLDEYDDDDHGDQESSCSSGSTGSTPSARHSPFASLSMYNNNDDNQYREISPEELVDDLYIIQSLQTEGERLEKQGLLLDALDAYQRLLELHRATGQSAHQIGKIHYHTGIIQYKLGNYNESLCHFDQALFIYQLNYDPDEDSNDISHTKNFYDVYYATGHVHLTNHNPYRAIDYFHRAMQFVQQLEQPSTTQFTSTDVNNNRNTTTKNNQTSKLYNQYYAQLLHALGTAHEAIGNDSEAVQYYQTAATLVLLPAPPSTL
jgi:hypothetical protein